jgi:hypothetical protein
LVLCKVLLRSLLVLAVLVSGIVFVGVAPASALAATWDIAAVRGTDNGVYVASYTSPGVWTKWASLAGATPSPPGICEEAGGIVYVVVRGTDNGIYVKAWSSGSGWSASWVSPPGGGRTIDTPACAYLGGIFVVVRGTNNELYWNSFSAGWSGWRDLHGKSASAPVLVSTPSLNRLDLVVQGTDNGIYHKAYTLGSWSTSWDSPGGKTLSKPAAVLHTDVSGCPSCVEEDVLFLIVRGTDNNVYQNLLFIGITGWVGWSSLIEQTVSAPTLAYDANGCSPGTKSNCHSIHALAVRGTNNAVYHNPYTTSWSALWDSPGGSISNSPALACIPVTGLYFVPQFLLLVEGGGNKLYSNTVTTTGSTWGSWSSVGGATNSDPALVAVV